MFKKTYIRTENTNPGSFCPLSASNIDDGKKYSDKECHSSWHDLRRDEEADEGQEDEEKGWHVYVDHVLLQAPLKDHGESSCLTSVFDGKIIRN